MDGPREIRQEFGYVPVRDGERSRKWKTLQDLVGIQGPVRPRTEIHVFCIPVTFSGIRETRANESLPLGTDFTRGHISALTRFWHLRCRLGHRPCQWQ